MLENTYGLAQADDVVFDDLEIGAQVKISGNDLRIVAHVSPLSMLIRTPFFLAAVLLNRPGGGSDGST
jgi:hypothetical protein